MPASPPVTPYTPAASDAVNDGYNDIKVTFNDPVDTPYPSHDPDRVDAQFFLARIQSEVLALIQGEVALPGYRQTYTCVSGLNVGDPVYLSADNTATLADATSITKNQCIGFCRYKPTTTTCYISHFASVTGLSGGTAGGSVYLTDAGGFSATPGTILTIIGRFKTATTAALFATPLPASSNNANLSAIILPEVDLKTPATSVFPLPSGFNGININEAGIIFTTLGGTLTGQASVSFGITGTDAKYLAAVATTFLTAVGKRERYTTLLADDRETVPNFTITSGATGSAAIKGRPYIIGVLS